MGCLTGEAAEVVAGVSLTDSAYKGVWQDLLARYDNQRVLLSEHMRHVLSCPAAVKSSAAEIKRVLGVLNQSRRALAALKRPVEHWDDWFVHLLVSKLDSMTRMYWETSLSDSREFPTYAQLQAYLENRIRALEAAKIEPSLPTRAGTGSSAKPATKTTRTSLNAAVVSKANSAKVCSMCQGGHPLSYCQKYKNLPVAQRGEQVKKLGACLNCIRPGHTADACPSSGRCLVCAGRHHTTLHGLNSKSQTAVGNKSLLNQEEEGAVADMSSLSASLNPVAAPEGRSVPLTTARVLLRGEAGQELKVRALLDTGSEASFVTERVAQQLRLKRRRVKVTVAGLQGTRTGQATSSVRLIVGSCVGPALRVETDAFVLRRLTNLLSARHNAETAWPHLTDLQLADPDFAVPAEVDVILGVDVYGQAGWQRSGESLDGENQGGSNQDPERATPGTVWRGSLGPIAGSAGAGAWPEGNSRCRVDECAGGPMLAARTRLTMETFCGSPRGRGLCLAIDGDTGPPGRDATKASDSHSNWMG
ncbi:PREDICTED: uncharacterized protein LOC105448380 [Wasmannia auropunctata]|uniref:uncharacterized protein LOC105448380 n=1 Tax=Wasmannia auropunctata TaxID=64793 RepID=UPI0005EF5842|nr:PREDICTED: uncharacterized protein LOC105448380 [Wasmannia auropunctata]